MGCYIGCKRSISYSRNIQWRGWHNISEKTVQYILAYLIKNKIFSYAIEVDKGELPQDEFHNRIEQSVNFKIDEASEVLETFFLQ